MYLSEVGMGLLPLAEHSELIALNEEMSFDDPFLLRAAPEHLKALVTAHLLREVTEPCAHFN